MKRMRKILFLLPVIIIGLLSCKNNTSETIINNTTDTSAMVESTNSAVDSSALSDGAHCYIFIMKRDTYLIELTVDKEDVKGTMKFKNYEKDSSKGIINGTIKDDVLNVNYRFNSEGMSSVRNMYFKVSDKVLITGIGDETSTGDSAYIKDPTMVRYDGVIYDEVACDKN